MPMLRVSCTAIFALLVATATVSAQVGEIGEGQGGGGTGGTGGSGNGGGTSVGNSGWDIWCHPSTIDVF